MRSGFKPLSNAYACYSLPVTLFGNGFELESSCGIQQGDVCEPAMFAIAIQKTVLELVDLNLTFQYWYLDDVYFADLPVMLRVLWYISKRNLSPRGCK